MHSKLIAKRMDDSNSTVLAAHGLRVLISHPAVEFRVP